MGKITPTIDIQKVTKSFSAEERPALDGISVQIKPGIITGLVGPDGAGKTTLIRLITGLMLPNKGDITVLGLNTKNEATKIHDIMGYMPQKFGLYEDLTVLENLNLYADLHGLTLQQKEEGIKKMLAFTSLAPFVDRLAGRLSGGMKQKLGLACALLNYPKVLVLDEPSVGVDPLSRRELWKMVQVLADQGITVLWSTSYLDEADKCQEVILLNEGKLLFHGDPKALSKKVEGRVFEITVSADERREKLETLLKQEYVIDGVIQGRKIRIVCAQDFPPAAKASDWRHVKPRFEDAFVDVLGGGPGGESILAKHMPFKKKTGTIPIQAEHLTKKFGSFTAAHNISFKVKRGEIFGLLGPNGAGKSTTFKMLCGLLTPTEGKALVSGYDLEYAPALARAKIGYMAQKFSLYGALSTRENLNFFSGVYGLQGMEQKRQISLMTQIFNLNPYLQVNAGTLPLGFKQRLALACSVMHEPDVLFLDEPTSGVDPITRREFWTHINGMAEKGVTIMVTTHFMDEAEYCDRISLIFQGTTIATGTPDDLKEMARTTKMPYPTLEDAFITLVDRSPEVSQEGSV